MPRSQYTAAKFISAVHRRLVLLRAVEQIGRGMMAASGLAIVLVCIAIWRSMPTAPVLLFCSVLGLLSGLIFAIYRWPSRLSAAAEADRQLRLEDLLTTCMLLSTTADEFSHAVATMADARCRLHSPSEVILRQFGVRSWSGIGLTMAIAATLAAIPLGPSRSQATDANISVLSENSLQPPGAIEMQQARGPVSPVNDPQSEDASSNSMAAERTADQAGTIPHSAPATPTAGDAAGTNGGSSNTAAGSRENLQSANSGPHPQDAAGTIAGGGIAAAANGGNDEPGGGTQRAADRSSTPNVNMVGNGSAGSPSSSAADDRIPAEDRDLVRDFFSR